MKNVTLWAGAGQIGMAIARRMGTGMKIVVGEMAEGDRIKCCRPLDYRTAKTGSAGFAICSRQFTLIDRNCFKFRIQIVPIRANIRTCEILKTACF